MEQTWFEMADIRRRHFASAVWLSLRAAETTEHLGTYAEIGYREVFFGSGSAAFPIDQREAVEKLGWSDIGIGQSHGPWIRGSEYVPSDRFDRGGSDGPVGLNLVLEQSGHGSTKAEWHLHQDLAIALGLFREGNSWVCPREGYVEVARLKRTDDGSPRLLEIRAEHLRDYLCARGLGLYITSYFQRDEILEDVSHIAWKKPERAEDAPGVVWEGRIIPIHEGTGSPFGSKTAVLHIANESLDQEADVPRFSLPATSDASSRSWTVEHKGRKVFRVIGEVWKQEWIAPLEHSRRVRGDELPATVSFIVDAAGTRETKETLDREGRWLWFRAEVANALLSYRDGHLEWHTGETGSIGIDRASAVHFGINSIGLASVYAKDIGQLDDWQQQLWAGYNVAPDGKVSPELMASQVDAQPAHTKAPEAFLERGLDQVNEAARAITGVPLLRQHSDIRDILRRCHRFRGLDAVGLLSLAKDLARLTADSIDVTGLLNVLPPSKEKIGSLKALERLIGRKTDEDTARRVMAPLFGIYDLRLADAHLPREQLADAYARAGIDVASKPIFQSFQMLHTLVSALHTIADLLTRDSKV